MTFTIMFIILVFAVVNLIVLNGMVISGDSWGFVNPFWLYKNTKVNWFGAFFIAIILNFLLPIIAIPYWVYKICTVGRE